MEWINSRISKRHEMSTNFKLSPISITFILLSTIIELYKICWSLCSSLHIYSLSLYALKIFNFIFIVFLLPLARALTLWNFTSCFPWLFWNNNWYTLLLCPQDWAYDTIIVHIHCKEPSPWKCKLHTMDQSGIFLGNCMEQWEGCSFLYPSLLYDEYRFREMGIPDHFTCFLRNLYASQEAAVKTGHGIDQF